MATKLRVTNRFSISPVTDEIQSTLTQIELATPLNEAEVETKILLHLFRILGYADMDRADKPTVTMHFGRERKTKQPDFILYEGGRGALLMH